jgi:hypothetical protein
MVRVLQSPDDETMYISQVSGAKLADARRAEVTSAEEPDGEEAAAEAINDDAAVEAIEDGAVTEAVEDGAVTQPVDDGVTERVGDIVTEAVDDTVTEPHVTAATVIDGDAERPTTEPGAGADASSPADGVEVTGEEKNEQT